MSETIERQDHERALAIARREGATAARRRYALLVSGVLGTVVVFLFATVTVGWSLATRAQEEAPAVIEEIAEERRAEMERRLSMRSQEAQVLASDMFLFLQRVWQENEALHQVRSNVQAATTELRLLTDEVNAAWESPTNNLGPLLENGPVRASAVLDYAVAVAAELQRLVPEVLRALKQAKVAADGAGDGSVLSAMLDSMDALLAPFIGSNEDLEQRWKRLQGDLHGWVQRVADDLELARQRMSGDDLSAEFMQRLRSRIF